MDDAIRYFRGEFTKGKAIIFIYYIKDIASSKYELLTIPDTLIISINLFSAYCS